MKYEDLIAHRLDSLKDYLGFDLTVTTDVPETYRRVSRTRGSGDWRNWFLDDDVAYFEPRLKSYLREFGYSDDWSLPEKPTLERSHAAGYVVNLVRGKGTFADLDFQTDAFSGLTMDSLRKAPVCIPGLKPVTRLPIMSVGAEIENIRLEARDGLRVHFIVPGQAYVLAFDIVLKQTIRRLEYLEYLVTIRPKGALKGALCRAAPEHENIGLLETGTILAIQIPFTFDLPPNVYFIGLTIVKDDEDGRFDVLAHYPDSAVFVITRFEPGVDVGPPVAKIIG
jgi:hypothetical protein